MTEYGKISLFYSYAHEDEASCHELIRYLQPLKEEGVISQWYDRRIVAGKDWASEIDQNLSRAKIVLLLFSQDFLNSKYCMGVELKKALDFHWEGRCRIIPVILRQCKWASTEMRTFQALPKDAVPISDWSSRPKAFASVADGIRAACQDIVDWENPYRRSSIGDWTAIEGTCLDKRTGQQVVTTTRLQVLAKSMKKKIATIGFTSTVNGQIVPIQPRMNASGAVSMGTDRLSISLDEPLEDQLGTLMRQLKENLPPNAEVERNETGRGEQKISIGGNQYYCTWKGYEVIIEVGFDRQVISGKTWRCIDVPLDGIVRWEAETPEMKMKSVLVDYGRGK